ncbi:hypothetical protein WJX84_008950 [Apatococcus fuscideae]|uniref:Uncharacterized protein n=1 Tax=Apatococcus fuscideae TaxID=2026836 RepID=A0AAW1SI57_9CHLO
MQASATRPSLRSPGLSRACRPGLCRVQASASRDNSQKVSASTVSKVAAQIAQAAGVLSAALLLTFEKLKGARVGPSDNEIRETQEVGKPTPPPPKRNLSEPPAPELESPFRKLFGGLFSRPRSEAARTAATVRTPTGNSPLEAPGQLGEQAKQAAGSIAESAPSPKGIQDQAKQAASTVAESGPSPQSLQDQAKQAVSTVTVGTPSPQGIQDQAKQAVSTVAENVPTPAASTDGGKDAIVSSSVQGVEAVTENAATQGPDAVPDQPADGTALSTSTQGSDELPGIAGPKPEESVTDASGIPNDPLKVTTDSATPNDPLNISSQSSVPQPLDTVADASMAAADTSNPILAKLRGAVESVAPSAADTATKAEPLQKGIDAGRKNLDQQSPLESTPLEQATKGETQASKGKDVSSE